MKRQKGSCTGLISLALLLVLCLGLVLGVFVLIDLPNRAAETFGPVSPRLDTLQQIRLSAQLLLQADDLTTPTNPLGGERPFQIPLGESSQAIAARLAADGLISNANAFTNYLVYTGQDTTLQAGEYLLSQTMTPVQIAQELQDATPTEITLNILEGWRMEEIAATLPTSGLEISPQEFLAAVRSNPAGYDFLEDLPPQASLEGFLSPGSYRLKRETTPTQLVTAFLDHFRADLTAEIEAGFSHQGLILFEAVILASIVEREAVVEEEMPLIASVFFNRLATGMHLDADSTVQYALGYHDVQKNWWTNPLSAQDLQVNSLYNTYQYPGLPPGPIANPGVNALRAVAFPAQTPYYYFRAACDGSGMHLFAETYEQQVGNACP